ncbi:MAG: universal stress protein [Phormidesmis sp.]
MFDTILLALDTDEDYSSVFNQALDQAVATGAVLKLLGAIMPANNNTMPLAAYYPEFVGYPMTISNQMWEDCRKRYDIYKKSAEAKLMRLAKQAAAVGVRAEVMQVEGAPGRAICDCAKSDSADLIIMGSHGRKGLSEIFMGSVSNYVTHHAPCSVLIVHTSPNNQEQKETAEVAEMAV